MGSPHATRRDPYAGADLENARRFGQALWVGGVLALAPLIPFFPPTAALGPVGWVIAAAFLPLFAVFAIRSYRRPQTFTWGVHLLLSVIAIVNLGVLQWLAGGWNAPYHHLFLALAVGNALCHPASRFWPLFGLISAGALSPVLYDQTAGRTPHMLVAVAMWALVSSFANDVMRHLRAQRLLLADSRDEHACAARQDQLTGLGNRRGFDEVLLGELEAGRAAARPLALAVADLDHFKKVNDVFGHQAGDAVLAEVAAALRANVRDEDLVFRWAGDEFAVVLRDSDLASAEHACRRLEEAIEACVVRPDGLPVKVTFGCAEAASDDDARSLMGAADRELLARKASRPALLTA